MPLYHIKVHDEIAGGVERIEIEADTADIYSNGTLVLKRSNQVVFGCVQQQWLQVTAEDDAGEAEVKRNGGRRHR